MAMHAFGPRLAPRLDESEAAPPISRRLPARKAALAGGRLQPSGSAPALRRRRGSSTSSLTLETPETPKVSASSTPDRRLAQVPSDGTGAFERARWAKKNVSLIDWKSAAARAVEDRASQKRQVPQSYDQDTRSHREEPSLFLSMQRELSAYEKACFQQRLLPKFMHRVREATANDVFDFCSSGVGDDQLVAIFSDGGLVPWDRIRRWRLRDARMRHLGAQHLAKRLNEEVEAIDLAKNEIGFAGALRLSSAFLRLTQLRRLDLSGNGLSDDAANVLAGALAGCPKLLRLDLQQNALQDGQHLGELIANHRQLTRLSLRRNRLTGCGMAALFRGILENARTGGQLADVDVAWNPMASDGLQAAKVIAMVFQESATLYHCDLSYCRLNCGACEVLGAGLRDNHSLYGLHVVGNSATMDADGFLTPMATERSHHDAGVLFGDLQPGPEALLGFNSEDLSGRDVLEMKSACWACEGWQRQEISWTYQDEDRPKAVWAYTSLDAFRRPLRLHPDPGQQRFLAARMVPPGYRLKVIFQVDSTLQLLPGERERMSPEVMLRICQELPELSPDAEQIARTDASPRSGRTVFIASLPEVSVLARTESSPSSKNARGVVSDGPEGSVLLPRVTETEFKSQVKRSPPFWQGFKRETFAMHREALRVDWLRCRLGHVVPESEIDDIKKALEPHYGWLMCLYRRVASSDVNGETGFGISQLQAGELMMNHSICDGSTTKVADIDRFFIAAKVTPQEMKKTLSVVNDKTLVRYEFLEFLLRVSHHHFLRTGAATTMAEATALMLKALEPEGRRAEQELNDFFRAFCVEAVDDIYKKHADLLAAVYKIFGGSKTPPGKPKYMALGEFQLLLELANAQTTGFLLRNSAWAFRMGMMCQTDESGASRFQEMSLVEFQMGVGAVAFLAARATSSSLVPTVKRLVQLLAAAMKERKDKPPK